MEGTSHPFMSTRQIGNAQVTVVGEMIGPAPIALNVPADVWRPQVLEGAEDGVTPASFTVTVVRLDDQVFVIDPSLDDPHSRLRNEVVAEYPHWSHGPGIEAALAMLRVNNNDVTDVLVTHAHFDHCLGIAVETDSGLQPRFRHARHVLGRGDWPVPGSAVTTPLPGAEEVFIRWTEQEMWPRLNAIRDWGLLDLVEGTTTIAPGVSMIPAPGESPGHMIVRIASEGAVFYHLGDLVHHWFEVDHPEWVVDEASNPRDVEVLQATRRTLFPLIAAEDAVVTFSHGPFPGWGRMVMQADGVRWRWL